MASRSLLDRFASAADPSPLDDTIGEPAALAERLWTVDARLAFPGLRLPVRMTVARLDDGGLWIHSPLRPLPRLLAALARLGPVRHIVAPNFVHHLFVNDFAAAHPEARLYLAPGLPERRPELRPGEALTDEAPPAWAGQIDQAVYGPVRGLSEVVFLHRPTRTLILTDLAFHPRSAASLGERLFWRLDGVWKRFGPGRTVRYTLFRDRSEIERIARRIDAWDFDRIVMAHGDVVEHDARATFRRAFAEWL